jgi:prepilin-type N-terminal cleavage/methylation domain-containing protein
MTANGQSAVSRGRDGTLPPADSIKPALSAGFTLIEMAIVLVIIGLIVGGVLVGQDLIEAANQRAQITQIEKYRTAANTFYGKYGYLPGDLPSTQAAQFGFVTRAGTQYNGDGNGLVETWWWGHSVGYVPSLTDVTFAKGRCRYSGTTFRRQGSSQRIWLAPIGHNPIRVTSLCHSFSHLLSTIPTVI